MSTTMRCEPICSRSGSDEGARDWIDPVSIVVLGSSNTDMILRVPRIPRPGETILGDRFATAAGGKGANQAVAAARAGGTVSLIARVGSDAFGDQALAGFEREGIGVEHVLRDPDEPSGVALIFVEESGENSIAVASGANAQLSPSDVEYAREAIVGASVLLMQLETPLETVEAAAQLARDGDTAVILNPAPARALPDALLARVAILTPNQAEAEQLSGIIVTDTHSAEKAGRHLIARGAGAVIITLGSGGAVWVTKDGAEAVEGHPIGAVDTTGAGDVFNGSLSTALAEQQAMREALEFANAAAALSVTRAGAQTSAPTRAEIDAFRRGQG
jgi:ribokinase